MNRKVKIEKIDDDIITLKNGKKVRLINPFDRSKIKGWSVFDDIGHKSIGVDTGLTNFTKLEYVKTEDV